MGFILRTAYRKLQGVPKATRTVTAAVIMQRAKIPRPILPNPGGSSRIRELCKGIST